jgi:hypothetical protein
MAHELEWAGGKLHSLPSLLRLFADFLEKQLRRIGKWRGGSMRSKKYGLNMTIVSLLEQIEDECQTEARKKLHRSEQWHGASEKQRMELFSECTGEPFWSDVADLLNRLLPDDPDGIIFSAESLKGFYRRQHSPR